MQLQMCTQVPHPQSDCNLDCQFQDGDIRSVMSPFHCREVHLGILAVGFGLAEICIKDNKCYHLLLISNIWTAKVHTLEIQHCRSL